MMGPTFERLGNIPEYDPETGEYIDLGLITYRITTIDPFRGKYVRLVKISEALEEEDPDMVTMLLERYDPPDYASQ